MAIPAQVPCCLHGAPSGKGSTHAPDTQRSPAEQSPEAHGAPTAGGVPQRPHVVFASRAQNVETHCALERHDAPMGNVPIAGRHAGRSPPRRRSHEVAEMDFAHASIEPGVAPLARGASS